MPKAYPAELRIRDELQAVSSQFAADTKSVTAITGLADAVGGLASQIDAGKDPTGMIYLITSHNGRYVAAFTAMGC